jgi:L-iditol 2-dehydrogenase
MAESGIALGDTVVVHGAGPIGLMFVRLATLRGANVISVDQTPWRLQQAQLAGAVQTIDLSDITDPEARVAAIKAATPGGRGADVGIEAVGLAAVWEQTVRSLRPGATAVLFGGTPKGAMFSVDSSAMHYEEYTLKGVFHHTPNYVRTAVELLASRKVDGHSLVTEVRPLEDLVMSLEDMAAGRGSKFVLTP